MAETPPKKRSEVRRALATAGVAIGAFYGIGYLMGNEISDKPTLDTRLEQIIKPQAIRIARLVLEQNMIRNNNTVITRPDKDADGNPEEIVSMKSFVDNKWITIDASMYRDQNGQLDVTTVNEVDLYEIACDAPGSGNECGGTSHTYEDIDLIYGSNTTFTKGNWGAEDTLDFPGNRPPNLVVNTEVKHPTEPSDKNDAQEAIINAYVFSRLGEVWLERALDGQIELPKPRE